jgi:hypothetical protein
MNKFVKRVSVFFLWLAAISVTAHLLIPHDHHLIDTFVSQDENCPDSDPRSGHHSGLPIHCQAFNDFTSERARPLLLTENLQFSFDFFSILTDVSTSLIESSFFSLKDFPKLLFDTSFLRSTSLRAPPALA